MKILFLILISLVTLTSCSVQQRAQRHLNRAIALDPTILSTLDTHVKIDTTVVHDTTIVVPATTDSIKTNIDSIVTQYKEKGQVTLLENNKLKVQLQNIKGHPTVIVDTKEIRVPVHDTVRVTLTKTIPAKVVHERVYLHGFFWWVGIVCTGLLGIFVIIFLIIKPNGIISKFSS